MDSAGIADYHVGELPNQRTMEVMKTNDLLPYTERSRQITRGDFLAFDYIFGMDCWNVQDLEVLSKDTPGSSAEIHMLREFDPEGCGNILDPYFVSRIMIIKNN